jgi:uncharacterized protein (DUF433 family)
MSTFALDRRICWPESSAHRKIPYLTNENIVAWPVAGEIKAVAHRDVSSRITYAVNLLEEVIVIDPETRGGVPVLVGTRVPISRLFAEVAMGRTIMDIADDKDLEIEAVRQVFKGFAAYLGRSYTP